MRDALEFARSGDTLIVWKLDRLARSMKQLIETIEKLRLRNIGFRSLTEALDTTTAQGRLVFHMFGALAEFERSLIRERTQAGVAAALNYCRAGGERRFVMRLHDHFGETPLARVDQAAVDAAALALYPRATPATRNRQVYSPVSPILKAAGVADGLKRPNEHAEQSAEARTADLLPNVWRQELSL